MNSPVDAEADVLVDETAAKTRRPRRRFALWFVHSSGRFDRTLKSWRRSLVRLSRRGSVITGTEAAGRTAEQFKQTLKRVGWDFAHLAGAALGECYATWDAEVLELFARPFARKLTDLTWVRAAEYGGKTAAKVHALVVPLQLRAGRKPRRYVLVIVHMPLDNTPARGAAWVDVCKGLAELEADLRRQWPDAEVIVVMDGNKDLRDAGERAAVHAHLEQPLKARVSWRTPYPKTGTHVRQLIDYALATAGLIVACQLLVDDDSSDHRPFRYRLRGAVRRLVQRIQTRLTTSKEKP